MQRYLRAVECHVRNAECQKAKLMLDRYIARNHHTHTSALLGRVLENYQYKLDQLATEWPLQDGRAEIGRFESDFREIMRLSEAIDKLLVMLKKELDSEYAAKIKNF